MTLEELKVEADKLGYKLIKKQEKVKFIPCVCGCNRREKWFGSGSETFFKCYKCGLESPRANTLNAAKLNWNKMIKEKLGENK